MSVSGGSSAGVLRWEDHRTHLLDLHAATLEAADPGHAVRGALSNPTLLGSGRVFLIALGKASIGMTRAALSIAGSRVAGGVVAYPHGLDPDPRWPSTMRSFAAGHPLPDEGSLRAGEAAWEMLGEARRGDLVLVLISGGGSALFEHLRPGVTLADVAALTRDLQHAGADILALNTVRRALSLVKGGGLANRAGEADVLALLLSDVVGDDPAAIASGPTVPSPTGPKDALAVLRQCGLAGRYPDVERALAAPETTGTGERNTLVIGSNRMAASAVHDRAQALGFHAKIGDEPLHGEARILGGRLGGAAAQLALPKPACFVMGGETTVTVHGTGRGGRNLELALGAALALDGVEGVALMAFATDGMDGSSGLAGAIVTGKTIARAKALGLSAEGALARNDSAPFFEALGDAIRTGPSGTNVNDLVILLAY